MAALRPWLPLLCRGLQFEAHHVSQLVGDDEDSRPRDIAHDHASTDELDQVRRFSLLILSDTHGAIIREAAPPKQ